MTGEEMRLEGPASAAELNRFGVWMWLASDSALFASLFGTYLTLRGATAGGPGPAQLFDLQLTAAATFVLLASSLAMGLALEALYAGRTRALRAWLAVTALLGAAFVGMQATEFTRYVRAGLTFAHSDFGSAFYALVGFHGLHVTFGVIWLVSLLVYTGRGRTRPAHGGAGDGGAAAPRGSGGAVGTARAALAPADAWRIEAASLYWYFVDVVWVLIFSVVYVLGKAG